MEKIISLQLEFNGVNSLNLNVMDFSQILIKKYIINKT